MELEFTPEELQFREEVRAFLRDELPADIAEKVRDRVDLSKDDIVRWQRILNARGWGVPSWPKQWGGTDWSPVQKYIFQEEAGLAGAPESLAFNTAMIGPVLIAFGTDAQKERFLKATANIDIWWCQGFSEPGSGSDLASLKTSAVRDGDHYVVNGQKIWTTLAQHADWIFALVRTDPTAKAQKGISFLLIDMKSPGITVRKIDTIDNHHEVNEVFFDDVRVPVENLVGEENRGWDYAKYLLSHERSNIARIGLSKERLAWLTTRGEEMAADGRLTESGHRRLKRDLASLAVDLKALELTQLRVVAEEASGSGGASAAASILKVKGTEIQQRVTELAIGLAGPEAMALPEQEVGRNTQDQARWIGNAAPTYFTTRKVTIYGGSNEIQRNIVAKAVLGL